MDDLFKKNPVKKKPQDKKIKPKEKPAKVQEVNKENHVIFMDVKAIELLDKITLTLKLENRKYTKGEAIYDSLKLLAKNKGINI